MIYEQFSPPAEHLAVDEESGEATAVDRRGNADEYVARADQLGLRPPYFAYAAALNAMDQPGDPEEERHVD